MSVMSERVVCVCLVCPRIHVCFSCRTCECVCLGVVVRASCVLCVCVLCVCDGCVLCVCVLCMCVLCICVVYSCCMCTFS